MQLQPLYWSLQDLSNGVLHDPNKQVLQKLGLLQLASESHGQRISRSCLHIVVQMPRTELNATRHAIVDRRTLTEWYSTKTHRSNCHQLSNNGQADFLGVGLRKSSTTPTTGWLFQLSLPLTKSLTSWGTFAGFALWMLAMDANEVAGALPPLVPPGAVPEGPDGLGRQQIE